jgi:nitrite reductase/ring-hydroxylating ferredoxin subunit
MSAPEGFRRVAAVAELRERRGVQILVEGRPVALWRVEGSVYAIDGLCPHMHFPTMHLAQLEGMAVTCPMHGWTFALGDGRELEGNGRVKTYRVHCEGGDVYIEDRGSVW